MRDVRCPERLPPWPSSRASPARKSSALTLGDVRRLAFRRWPKRCEFSLDGAWKFQRPKKTGLAWRRRNDERRLGGNQGGVEISIGNHKKPIYTADCRSSTSRHSAPTSFDPPKRWSGGMNVT